MEGLSDVPADLASRIVTGVEGEGTVALILLGVAVVGWMLVGYMLWRSDKREAALQAKIDALTQDAIKVARDNVDVLQGNTSSLQSIKALLDQQKSPLDMLREFRDLLDRERTRG